MKIELEKIRTSIDHAELNPELSKSQVRQIANRAWQRGVLSDPGLAETYMALKDKAQSALDALEVLKSFINK